jgi:hypothetical protein
MQLQWFRCVCVLFSALMLVRCGSGNGILSPGTDADRRATIRPVSQVKPLKFPKGVQIIRVPNFIGSAKLGFCPPKKVTPDPADPGVGGFACWTIYPVDLQVWSDPAKPDVNVINGYLKLRPGDCVRWKVIKMTAGDTSHAGITLINFFDTEQEAKDASKNPPLYSKYPVGRDFCTENTPYCFMYVALDQGVYRYQVKIDHGGTAKIVDPDLEVACSGTGCGDPEDVAAP